MLEKLDWNPSSAVKADSERQEQIVLTEPAVCREASSKGEAYAVAREEL